MEQKKALTTTDDEAEVYAYFPSDDNASEDETATDKIINAVKKVKKTVKAMFLGEEAEAAEPGGNSGYPGGFMAVERAWTGGRHRGVNEGGRGQSGNPGGTYGGGESMDGGRFGRCKFGSGGYWRVRRFS